MIGNSTIETWSIIAAVATGMQLLALIALHLLPTGYSPVRDAVSDYGVGPYRAGFWAQALAGGIASLAQRSPSPSCTPSSQTSSSSC